MKVELTPTRIQAPYIVQTSVSDEEVVPGALDALSAILNSIYTDREDLFNLMISIPGATLEERLKIHNITNSLISLSQLAEYIERVRLDTTTMAIPASPAYQFGYLGNCDVPPRDYTAFADSSVN